MYWSADSHSTPYFILVPHCLPQVWVKPELRADGLIYWSADSDSALTKGLAALLVTGLSGCTAQEIMQVSGVGGAGHGPERVHSAGDHMPASQPDEQPPPTSPGLGGCRPQDIMHTKHTCTPPRCSQPLSRCWA